MIDSTPSLLRPHDDALRELLDRNSRDAWLAEAKEIQSSASATADERATAAFCLWRARQWKRASRQSEEALSAEVTAWTVCVHAYCLMADRDWDKLGDDRDAVARLLEDAARLPGAPEIAILRSLPRLGSTGVEAMERLVEEQHASRTVRLLLARARLGYEPNPDDALVALAPLLEERPVEHDAAWLGAIACFIRSDPEGALRLVEASVFPPHGWEPWEALRAKLLARVGRKEESMVSWGRLVASGDAKTRVKALFARAEILLDAGNAAAAAAEVWPAVMECHSAPRAHTAWAVRCGESVEHLPPLRHPEVAQAAARLVLLESVPALDSRTLGRLALIALEAGLADAAAAVGLDQDDAADLLTETADSYAPDSRLHVHLAQRHARAGRWTEALRHGLTSAIAASADQADALSVPSIGVAIPWAELQTTELLPIHNEIVAALAHPLATQAKRVFLHLYQSGWHQAVLGAGMVAEAAAASQAIAGHTRTEAIESAALGYRAELDGDLGRAERWYQLGCV
jgi:hypothetical protein